MFGGFPESGLYFDDLWVYSFKTSSWSEVTSTSETSPSSLYLAGRKAHACFIDEVKRLYYVFGGESNLGVLNDMWALSLETFTVKYRQWTEIATSGIKPFGVNSFAYTTYLDNGKLKFAIVRGTGLYEVLLGVYM